MNNMLLLFIICVFCISVILVYNLKTIQYDGFNINGKNNKFKITPYIINMDKNTNRMTNVLRNYNNSDMAELKLHRYSAIVGKDVSFKNWLTSKAVIELEQVERNKYRLYHYQLTPGGVGCFLSHYNIMNKLINDLTCDYYFIMEDDITFNKNVLFNVRKSILQAPPNWDMLLYGYIRTVNNPTFNNELFMKLHAFWGMQGYIISKAGAKKIIAEVHKNKIDGQIDAYLSRMIQQNKINIYAYKNLVIQTVDAITDIQEKIMPQLNINPFFYHGYYV